MLFSFGVFLEATLYPVMVFGGIHVDLLYDIPFLVSFFISPLSSFLFPYPPPIFRPQSKPIFPPHFSSRFGRRGWWETRGLKRGGGQKGGQRRRWETKRVYMCVAKVWASRKGQGIHWPEVQGAKGADMSAKKRSVHITLSNTPPSAHVLHAFATALFFFSQPFPIPPHFL